MAPLGGDVSTIDESVTMSGKRKINCGSDDIFLNSRITRGYGRPGLVNRVCLMRSRMRGLKSGQPDEQVFGVI